MEWIPFVCVPVFLLVSDCLVADVCVDGEELRAWPKTFRRTNQKRRLVDAQFCLTRAFKSLQSLKKFFKSLQTFMRDFTSFPCFYAASCDLQLRKSHILGMKRKTRLGGVCCAKALAKHMSLIPLLIPGRFSRYHIHSFFSIDMGRWVKPPIHNAGCLVAFIAVYEMENKIKL